MKIGILGSGDVGQSLGKGFTSRDHTVRMGSRTPGSEKVQAWVAQAGPRASAGTFAEAAAFGELLVLSTLWGGTQSAIEQAGAHNFAGKVVLDTTNPLVFTPNAPPTLAVGHTDSAGEQVQRWLPRARVVKVFNTVGHAHMVDPQFPGGPPDMFLCGEDPEAKRVAAQICRSFGWSTVDVGGIEGARLLEPMCALWVGHGLRTGSWNHAFKLLRK
ncbi:MAG TPA: NAD(P)-binding domain-containing protein [Candidatus Saccharimonadales bacterium]|nr:NAD(P)-binding domain-containing protein [Candidatus Saccharimonadales bacterium]